MKKALFIGVTKYNLEADRHLEKKFGGLSQGIKPYLIARGRPFHSYLWGTDFYLFPKAVFWPLAFLLSFYLCLFKGINTIVAQSPLTEGFLGAILKKILKKELIVEIHGDWGVRKTLSIIAPISLKNADKIRGVAQYLIDKAKKFAPKKPYYLFPTFTDLDDFLGEKDVTFEKFILFVGRAHKIKGVNYLIGAFSKIEKDFPDFKLVLVGEGLPEGKLSLAEVKNKMKKCYCLVVPSLSEGLPRVILEAMALGKPVVASRVGGIPEVIQDGKTGFLFEPGNQSDLTEKLRVLLQDYDLARRTGEEGKRFVRDKFSNLKYVENYLKMLQD
ncbi:MAG: glycosyltransferase family 4 protein [Candidatus Nealsonbacteria bacterium]|nr:glycosyltransferase family 4 protein [Candidatus Nealsonbacteria bacterium]